MPNSDGRGQTKFCPHPRTQAATSCLPLIRNEYAHFFLVLLTINFLDSASKKQSGRKAQISNITAAKIFLVSFWE